MSIGTSIRGPITVAKASFILFSLLGYGINGARINGARPHFASPMIRPDPIKRNKMLGFFIMGIQVNKKQRIR